MEQAVKKQRSSPLRRAFYQYVLATFTLIVVLSGIVIITCGMIQNWLLPNENECYLIVEKTYADGSVSSSSSLMQMGEDADDIPVMLTGEEVSNAAVSEKYAVEPYGKTPDLLSPKRKFLYHFCTVAKVAVPVFLSFAGILVCGMLFYKRRLQVPIDILSEGASHIAEKNLDFEITYTTKDELGALCEAFEVMRSSLEENNKSMWRMVEDSRRLQASVAHDLRNPITVIKGYAEYLKINIPMGQLGTDKTLEIADKIEKAAYRMEQYTESVRKVNYLEEITPAKEEVCLKELIGDLISDIEQLCRTKNISLITKTQISNQTIQTDREIISRIAENIVSNALRYAKNEMQLSFYEAQQKFIIEITDDGCGFPQKVLDKGIQSTHFKSSTEGHLGMGLYICYTLCRKLDGEMELANSEQGGAVVKIFFPL